MRLEFRPGVDFQGLAAILSIRIAGGAPPMKKTQHVRLTGKPGNWVAVELKSRRVVAEGATLKAVAKTVARKRLKHTSFTRVPSPDCALIL
jgi:hypothetical protein